MPIRFYLHTFVSAKGRRPIYIEVRWAREAAATGALAAVRLSTGKTCLAADWNDDKERVGGKDLRRGKINERLGELEKAATKALNQAEVLGTTLTAADMRTVLLAITKPSTVPEATPEPEAQANPADWTLPEVVANWQQQLRGQRAPGYLRLMGAVSAYWEAMRPGTKLGELLPDAKTGRSVLVEQWIGYLLEDVPRRGTDQVGLDNNTVGAYIKRLRTLLQFAGLPYAWLKDELTYDIEIEPLEYEEVLQLATAKLPRRQLEHARDCFVFNCFTGPRYQNLKNLTPADVRLVQGVPLLEYAQIKGRKKTKVKVALSPLALEIWERYQGQLPVMANQAMNMLIKEVAELAGLTRPISRVRQYGGKQLTERGPIHEFITCHLARHTFATLLLDGDASIVEVQDSLGHSSLQSTRRYAKAREKQRHASTLTAFDKLQQAHVAQTSHSA